MALAASSLGFDSNGRTQLKDKVVKKKYAVPGSANEYEYIPATAQIPSVQRKQGQINNIAGIQQTVDPNASQQEQMHQWLLDNGYDYYGNPVGNTSSSVNTPVYSKPQSNLSQYDWGDGSEYLTPDNPLVRPVVYENEFSPESTMSIASDVYNKYYADMVAEQQRQNTQNYRNTAQEASAVAGAAGMATGSRGAIQLANQANREAQQTNLQYQQQMQLQAFQETLDARNLELQNKIQDYQNAWEEVSQYGYVVTEATGALLGIQPGQQLTTVAYKTAMSNIARNVADINAQKVQLDQQQQQLDQAWIKFQEDVRQFNLGYELDKQSLSMQKDQTIYDRLTDMLQRYDTVTPEMVALGNQVGMRLTVGDSTVNYMSELERYQNNQAAAGNQTYTDSYIKQQLASSYIEGIQRTGKITNASQFATVLADWVTQGVNPLSAMEMVDDNGVVTINGTQYELESIVGKTKTSKDAAKQLISTYLSQNNSAYDYYNKSNGYSTGKTWGTIGTIAGTALAGLGALTLNPFLFAAGVTGATAAGTGIGLNNYGQAKLDREYYG